jgi:hypothetical protein
MPVCILVRLFQKFLKTVIKILNDSLVQSAIQEIGLQVLTDRRDLLPQGKLPLHIRTS